MRTTNFFRPNRQRGAVLLVAMCVMLALLIIGVSAARTAQNSEKSARGERDRQVAFQAAEAALGDAERDIEGTALQGAARAAMFAHGSSAGFVDGCGVGEHNPGLGLCRRGGALTLPGWQRAPLTEVAGPRARTVEYGRFTGAFMPVGRGTLPSRLPRYVIELLPYSHAGHDAARREANFYRITAIGFGPNDAARVVLQSFYLKSNTGEPS